MNKRRQYWNPDIECLDRLSLRKLQLRRLRTQLFYNYENSIFFKNKFKDAGLRPEDIHNFDDFAKLPVMTKEEHRAAQAESLERYGNPYELLACAPAEQIVRINATSGTTGTPTLYTLTAQDIEVVNEMHARKYWRAGVRPGDVMLQALSLSMFTGGLPLSQGIMNMGACVVPVGIEGGSRRVLEFAQLTRPSALIATPSFGLYLLEECEKITGKPATQLGLKWFFCAGEPGGSESEVRQLLAAGFGVKVFDHTGGGHAFHAISADEAAVHSSGMYLVSEDHCLLELLDPQTRKAVTIRDGAEGEMVWTFLQWQGGPYMRYAMGDVVKVWTEKKPGAWPGLRFKIIGRVDDLLIVKGVNVYPAAIQNAILHFRPRVSGVFRILLQQPGPSVVPPLQLRVEFSETLTRHDIQALEKEMIPYFRDRLRIKPEIIWVPAGTYPQPDMKMKLVEIET